MSHNLFSSLHHFRECAIITILYPNMIARSIIAALFAIVSALLQSTFALAPQPQESKTVPRCEYYLGGWGLISCVTLVLPGGSHCNQDLLATLRESKPARSKTEYFAVSSQGDECIVQLDVNNAKGRLSDVPVSLFKDLGVDAPDCVSILSMARSSSGSIWLLLIGESGRNSRTGGIHGHVGSQMLSSTEAMNESYLTTRQINTRTTSVQLTTSCTRLSRTSFPRQF